ERPARVVIHFLHLKELLGLGAPSRRFGRAHRNRGLRRRRIRQRIVFERQLPARGRRRRGLLLGRGQVVGQNLQRLGDVGAVFARDHARGRGLGLGTLLLG